MSKQRNPNGQGNFRKLADGRYAWRQTIDGKTREISAKTPKELKEKIKQIANLPIISEKYIATEWFDRWLENYIKPLKKQATYNQYDDIYRVHIKPVIGHKKLTNIKPIDIQSVITEMNKKDYATQTMKHAKNVMKCAFDRAVKDNILGVNPVINIDIPVKQKKERKTLTNEELRLLFDRLKTSRWIHSVKFALVTGLRRGELLALEWSDIDFVNKTININKSLSLTGLGDTKTSKAHYVPLSDKALGYLNDQKQQLIKENNPILIKDELKESNLIFPNNQGVYIRPDSYYKIIARAAAKMGIKASPHCLRHTFVYMTRETLTLKEIQAVLGHDESTTTLDIYGDMINNSSKTINKINDVFAKLDEEVKIINHKKDNVLQFKKIK